MSDELLLVITEAGLAECISAKDKGLSLNLKYVSAGDSAYTPSAQQTALVNELQRVEFGEYIDLGDNQIRCVGKFSGELEFAIRELGFWTEAGTLFGVISAPDTTLNYKVKDGTCIQPLTLDLRALPSDAITIVVGTENINILIDLEMLMSATTFLRSQKIQITQAQMQMQLSEKIRKLENV